MAGRIRRVIRAPGKAARSARKPGVAITTSPVQFGARTTMLRNASVAVLRRELPPHGA